LLATRRLDVRLSVLPSVAQPIKHRQRLLLYHGTAEHLVELSLLDTDELRAGEQGLAQLFAETPIVALDGDRFILRIPSPPETVAGGMILDVKPRRHRRRDAATLRSLAARERADPETAVLLELAKHPFGLTGSELGDRLGMHPDQLADVLVTMAGGAAIQRVGPRVLAAERWKAITTRITDTLSLFHRAQPLRRGMSREELRTRSGLPPELFAAVVVALVAEGPLVERGSEVGLSSHRLGLTDQQEAAASAPPDRPGAAAVSRHRGSHRPA
jgi:selenocysteine-specific elongation factor